MTTHRQQRVYKNSRGTTMGGRLRNRGRDTSYSAVTSLGTKTWAYMAKRPNAPCVKPVGVAASPTCPRPIKSQTSSNGMAQGTPDVDSTDTAWLYTYIASKHLTIKTEMYAERPGQHSEEMCDGEQSKEMCRNKSLRNFEGCCVHRALLSVTEACLRMKEDDPQSARPTRDHNVLPCAVPNARGVR